jgi:hypothetical protein
MDKSRTRATPSGQATDARGVPGELGPLHRENGDEE